MEKRINELIELTKNKENFNNKEKAEKLWKELESILLDKNTPKEYIRKLHGEAFLEIVYMRYKYYLWNEEHPEDDS